MVNKRVMQPLFNNLIQVGMVVKNLKESMAKYLNYGIGPFYVIRFSPDNVSEMSIYGKRKEYSMNLGVCTIGSVRFELIEPESESIYSRYLEDYGEGIIHHLKVGVKDYGYTLNYLESLGFKNIQSGHQIGVKGKNIYNYLNTTGSLGFISEIVNVTGNFKKPLPDAWYPDNNSYNPLFNNPSHIGIVIKNLSQKIKQYKEIFGLNLLHKEKYNSKNVSDMYLYEKRKNYSNKVAFFDLGNVVIKLIEPLGYSIFSDFLEKHGEGFVHHLGMEVDDYERSVKTLLSKDARIIKSGCYLGKTEYAYFSTGPDLNFITEISDSNSRFLP